ncbi:hypothetical protein ACS0TY_030812 [Phlomoides rotata]
MNSYLPIRSGIRVWRGANYSVRHRKLLSSDRSNKTLVLSPAVATEHRPRRGSEQIAIQNKEGALCQAQEAPELMWLNKTPVLSLNRRGSEHTTSDKKGALT